MAEQARQSAVRANTADAREQFLRLAERYDAAALAEESGEDPPEDEIRWPFR
jgi:hypothetical protein